MSQSHGHTRPLTLTDASGSPTGAATRSLNLETNECCQTVGRRNSTAPHSPAAAAKKTLIRFTPSTQQCVKRPYKAPQALKPVSIQHSCNASMKRLLLPPTHHDYNQQS